MREGTDSPLVTCSMIVRDEAHNLQACFAAAAPLVDEVIVVDTGSSDGTPELAERLGAKVLHVPWCDDFSFVRNKSLEPATGTWTIVLDADDRLEGAEELRAFLEAGPPEDALCMLVRSPLPGSAASEGREAATESLWQPRVFGTSAGVRYRYPVHNIPILDGLEVGAAPGVIHHVGYLDADQKRAKAERTLRLLNKLPEGHPHRLYHHIRALAGLGRFEEVPALAERLAGTIDVLPPDVRVMWAQALLQQASPRRAVQVLADGLDDHSDHPDLFYGLLMAAGVGYAGASLDIQRDLGMFSGVAATLGRAPRVVEGLVHMGILLPGVLDSEVMGPARTGSVGQEIERDEGASTP